MSWAGAMPAKPGKAGQVNRPQKLIGNTLMRGEAETIAQPASGMPIMKT